MYIDCIRFVAHRQHTTDTLTPPFALQDGAELLVLRGEVNGYALGAIVIPWVVELPRCVTGPVCSVAEVLEELARTHPHEEEEARFPFTLCENW
jgi:hypothetical protein